MTGLRLRHGSMVFLATLALGCGGGRGQFSPAAVPIAVKLRDSLATSNHSELGSAMERARELHNGRAITDGDLKLFVLIFEMANGNNHEDAKKVLEEALGNKQ